MNIFEVNVGKVSLTKKDFVRSGGQADVYAKKKIEEEKVRELLGHTPVQVIAGAALGILVALVLSR